MTATESDCLFCGIVAGVVPADVVRRDDHSIAFRDINPQAPTHILLVPIAHHPHAAALAAEEPRQLAGLVAAAAELAESEGIAGSGYRLVFNTGDAAGQSVQHTHLHLLGGRTMAWPPG